MSGCCVPAIAKGVALLRCSTVDLVLGIAVVAAAELHLMLPLCDGQANDLVIVLGAIGPRIASRSPGGVEGAQRDVGQALPIVILTGEVGSRCPTRRVDEAASAFRHRNNGDLVAVVVERSFQQYVGRECAGQLDD